MEKFMMVYDRKSRTVHKLYHGDDIYASIGHAEEDEEDDRIWVTGKLCLNDNDKTYDHGGHIRGWICQDKESGCEEAEDRFGYQYSWTFTVSKEGRIESSDTYAVTPVNQPAVELEPVACNPCTEHQLISAVVIDEDVMPEDWVMDVVIPKNL